MALASVVGAGTACAPRQDKEGVMTCNFTRILVPTDFSAPSTAALTLAKRMAAMSGASLHLLHVLDDTMTTAAATVGVYAPTADLRNKWLEGARDLLGTQLTPEEQASFRSTEVVMFGTPARTIVEHAKATGIDLIVMGTHGRGAVEHILMGSVAERVVRSAVCPVLTVRDNGAVRTATAESDAAVA
jgi:nucleotide-binding universal stress UspA family protein